MIAIEKGPVNEKDKGMAYLEIVDEVDKEVSKLNAIAQLISGQSETLQGIAHILTDSAAKIRNLISDYSP